MALAPIINSAETINADAASSLNRVFTKLAAAFGLWPRVLSPYGGARTKAEQAYLVSIGKSDTMNSDHREDAVGRAAVDIDNHSAFRNKNQALFLSILADEGWHNMTTTGAPFTKEPWHFAKHGIVPAGNGTTPIANTKGEAMSILLIPNNDDNKWYAQSPLTGLAVVVADADVAIMLRYMEWVHGTANDQENRWNAAAFVTVKKYIVAINPPTSGGVGAVDLTPILAAIAALDKQGDDYQAKVEGILNKGLTISGTATPGK